MKYGNLPADLGPLRVVLPEVMYYLYLPVKLVGAEDVTIPRQLFPIIGLLDRIRDDLGHEMWISNNIYVTAKKMFVSPTVTANRPGWHADGFGTNDLNYVWYDCLPTLFNNSTFTITEGDHVKSLREFEDQALPKNNVVYPSGHLLRLDSSVVHAVAPAEEQMMRTFIKVSVSPDPYNLKDNSINHQLEYNWQQYDRAVVRNDPNHAQRDSYRPPTPVDDHFK